MQSQVAYLFGVLCVVLVLGFIVNYPTMLLWNYCLVPAVGGINEVGFWQMFGINFLCSILFKTTVNTKN